MSSNLAYARPATRPMPTPRTRPVHAVPRRVEVAASRQQRRARPRAAYAVVTVVSLFAIFAAQLLLSIVVSKGAYEIESLQDQKTQLMRTQEALTENLELYGSTQNLAASAAHLGMVPSASPLFLDLATGAVSGAPGSIDRVGCGGACNLVPNALLVGASPVVAAPTGSAPTTTGALTTAGLAPATATASTPPAPAPAPVDTLPAPVTH